MADVRLGICTCRHSCPRVLLTTRNPLPSLSLINSHTYIHLTHSLSLDLLWNCDLPDSVSQVPGLKINVYNLFLNLPILKLFSKSFQKAALVLIDVCASENESACRWPVLTAAEQQTEQGLCAPSFSCRYLQVKPWKQNQKAKSEWWAQARKVNTVF